MPRKLERPTLIAGICAVGSLLLCCLSGTIGWFNIYWAIASATAICFFFVLIVCSTGLSFLPSCKNHRRETVWIISSIATLVAAHLFVIAYNVSPGENLLGNHDQGMYLAAASHLKTNGGHAMITDWIRKSPAEYKCFLTKEISPSLKTESPDNITNTGTQAGFYLMDENGHSQYIQFPPGYPTVLAIFWSLGGYPLVLYSNVIICLLCGLMLAFVCQDFLGAAGTLATWLLFLFCPLTIWSANNLYAEPTLLLLWFTALWTLRFSKKYPLLSATLASLSIGAAFLIKIDALPLFVLSLTYAFIYRGGRLRFPATFLILSIVAYIITTGFYLHYSKPYFEFTLSGILSAHFFLGVVCALSLVTIALTVKTVRLKLSAIIRANSQLLRYCLAIFIGLILIYFYFVRPLTDNPHRVFADESGATIESLREQTFYRLGWYFTPFGLALASAGLIAAFIRRAHPAQLAFAGIALLFLLYYSYDLHCTPYQPYAMRRLFPFVVPALCFAIPFLIQTMAVKLRSPKRAGLLILPVTAILLAQFQQITQKLIVRENYKGLYQYLSNASQRLPKDELILINGKGQAYLYAAALRYIFERKCILVYPDYRARDYHTMIDDLMANKDRSVYVLSTFPNDRIHLRAEILSTQKLSDTLHTTYSGTTTTCYPDNDVKPFKLSLYLTEIKMQ